MALKVWSYVSGRKRKQRQHGDIECASEPAVGIGGRRSKLSRALGKWTRWKGGISPEEKALEWGGRWRWQLSSCISRRESVVPGQCHLRLPFCVRDGHWLVDECVKR